jgi:hypothetical protein
VKPVLAVVLGALSLVMALPARAMPRELPPLRLSTTRMGDGGSVTASGTGCTASQVRVGFNRGQVAFNGDQTPDESGSWSQPFDRSAWTVPGWSPGHFTVSAWCQTTPEEAYPDADFVALPEPSPIIDGPLQQSTDTVQAGETITLTGTWAPQYDPTAFLLPEGIYLGHVPAAGGGDFAPTVYELTVQIPADAVAGEHTIAVFGNQPNVFAIMRWALGSSLMITPPPTTTTEPAATVPATTAAPTTTPASTPTSVLSSATASTNTTTAAVASAQDNQDGSGSTPWGAIAAVAGGGTAAAIGLGWWRIRRRAIGPDTPPVDILDQ